LRSLIFLSRPSGLGGGASRGSGRCLGAICSCACRVAEGSRGWSPLTVRQSESTGKDGGLAGNGLVKTQERGLNGRATGVMAPRQVCLERGEERVYGGPSSRSDGGAYDRISSHLEGSGWPHKNIVRMVGEYEAQGYVNEPKMPPAGPASPPSPKGSPFVVDQR